MIFLNSTYLAIVVNLPIVQIFSKIGNSGIGTFVIIFLVFNIILGSILLYNYRLRLLRNVKEHLEEQLQETVSELTIKNRQISTQAQLLDLERQRLDNVNAKLAFTLGNLEEANKKTLDSIRYAKRIQSTILPNYRKFKTYFPDSFVYNRPKDIVSGDFYWLATNKNGIFLAVADCTGHGVPGAFMSMLGYSQLKNLIANDTNIQLTNNDNTQSVGQTLVTLDQSITDILKNNADSGETEDGMEMCLLRLSDNQRQLKYASARRPIFVVRKGALIILKPERFSIGGIHQSGTTKLFPETTFNLQTEDMVYLFTDGFVGQLGGAHYRKFNLPQFRQLFIDVAHLPTARQKAVINQTIKAWQANNDQTDDMLIVGFRIS